MNNKIKFSFVFFLIIFAFLFLIPSKALATATNCSLLNAKWNREQQFYCVKDDYRQDKILITNLSNFYTNISVDKRIGKCGFNGFRSSSQRIRLGSHKSLEINFEKAAPNECRELFVRDCIFCTVRTAFE